MIIALFGTAEDRPYLERFRPLVGSHNIKVNSTPEEYVSSIAAKVKSNKIESIICACPVTLVTLLNTQLDFRHPVDKRGTKRKLALDDYAGSFFHIPGAKLGVEWGVSVLIVNPLKHLITTPEGEFVFKRFISKITRPDAWFPQTAFTWEIWKPQTSNALLQKFSTAKILAVDIETYVGDELRRIHCVGYAALFDDGTTHCVVVPFKNLWSRRSI